MGRDEAQFISEAHTVIPRVTVAVPVYNGAATLEKALASIEAQTFRDIKVIIADNASTDGTSEIIRRWSEGKSNVQVISRQEMVPAAENFYSLAREADTEYFVWLADDDFWQLDYLSACVAALDANPAAHAAFSHYRQHFHFDGSEGEIVKHLPSTTWDKALRLTIRFADPAPCSYYGVMRTDTVKWLIEFAGDPGFDYSDVFFTLALANGGMLEIVPRDLFRSGVRRQQEVQRRSMDGGKIRYWPFVKKATGLFFHVLPFWEALLVSVTFWWRTYKLRQHHLGK